MTIKSMWDGWLLEVAFACDGHAIGDKCRPDLNLRPDFEILAGLHCKLCGRLLKMHSSA